MVWWATPVLAQDVLVLKNGDSLTGEIEGLTRGCPRTSLAGTIAGTICRPGCNEGLAAFV